MVEGGKDKAKNPMKDLRIRKLCLNICVGESGGRQGAGVFDLSNPGVL